MSYYTKPRKTETNINFVEGEVFGVGDPFLADTDPYIVVDGTGITGD